MHFACDSVCSVPHIRPWSTDVDVANDKQLTILTFQSKIKIQ
jgi:hypothetical protein